MRRPLVLPRGEAPAVTSGARISSRRHVCLPSVAAALLAAIVMMLTGCGTAPSSGPPKLSPPPGVTLPIPARVAVQVDPSMPNTQTVEFRGDTWQYPEAELMQQAAMKVFREMFGEVGTPQSVTAPAITIRLTGYSSVNPIMSEYYATPTATVFAGGDTYAQPLGTFSGNGTASQPNFSRAGVASAYEGGFRQIGNRMLADPSLLARLRGK